MQTQSRNLTAGQVLATQTIYNSEGQAVLSTLPAPILNQSLNFKEQFVRPIGSTADYGAANFETAVGYSPAPLDTIFPGTLGNYYSQANYLEQHTPATHYPFSLAETSDGVLGNVSRAMGPGEANRLGGGNELRSGTVPILDELDDYAYRRHASFGLPLVVNPLTLDINGNPKQSYKLQGTKSITIAPDGTESISFSNKEGQTLATCRTAPGSSFGLYHLTATISAAGTAAAPTFVDLHVPADGAVLTIYAADSYATTPDPTGGGTCRVVSLLNDGAPQTLNVGPYYAGRATTGVQPLPQGFYRIVALTGKPLTVTYDVRYGEFSYTYYNAAGQAVASVEPLGVPTLDTRFLGTPTTPPPAPLPHVTTNTYSTTGQLLRSFNYDAGQSDFVYRADGTLRFSRSAEQAKDKGAGVREFSYSNYDSLSRVIESGIYQTKTGTTRTVFEPHGTGTPAATSVLQAALLEDRTRTGGLDHNYCSQINSVWYDHPFDDDLTELSLPSTRKQRFVMGAVAKTATTGFTTWYSYDDQGRLTWLVQRGPVGVKTIDYRYDVSGNVEEVIYQKDQPDAYTHYYEYDADQRLRAVYASPDGINRTQLAHYEYYLHGPLKRAELADRMQGVDYRYTINGWLKSVNEVRTGPTFDPGHDDPATNGVPQDLFSLRLEYFAGDYRSTAQKLAGLPPSVQFTGAGAANRPDRYDGTIHAATWHTAAAPKLHTVAYNYDDQGQFTGSLYGEQLTTQPRLFQPSSVNAYAEHGIAYDPNGNIKSLKRTDGMGGNTADYSYTYELNNNRLIKIRPPGVDQVLVGAYDYNEIGETIHQNVDGEDRYLTYDASGKVTGVYKDADHEQVIATYTYDDRGFRATQTVRRAVPLDPEPTPGGGGGSSAKGEAVGGPIAHQTVNCITHYVRDAAGNVLSVYEQVGETGSIQQTEVPLYAASRVGTRLRLKTTEADHSPDAPDGAFDQHYELTDHLGSARVIFHQPTVQVTRAGLELADAAQEEEDFENLPDTRTKVAALARTGEYVAMITPNGPLEPATAVTVQTGDSVVFSAWAFIPEVGSVPRPAPQLLLGAGAPTAANALLTQTTATGSSPTASGGAELVPAKAHGGGFGQVLRRLSVGLGFGLGGYAVAQNSAPGTTPPIGATVPDADAGLYYKVLDANGNAVADGYQPVLDYALEGWQQVKVSLRVAQAGTVHLQLMGRNSTLRPVLFDDLAVRHRGGLIIQEQHQYPYGAPLTGLSYTVGNRRYRHGYQGQYAETDTTTGWESFELRLYDAARARWFAPDPEGQFVSPYIAMGNNPVSGVDPDGGFSASFNWSSTGAIAGAAIGGALGAIAAPKGKALAYGIAGGVIGGIAGGFLGAAGDGATRDANFFDYAKEVMGEGTVESGGSCARFRPTNRFNFSFGSAKKAASVASRSNPVNRTFTTLSKEFDNVLDGGGFIPLSDYSVVVNTAASVFQGISEISFMPNPKLASASASPGFFNLNSNNRSIASGVLSRTRPIGPYFNSGQYSLTFSLSERVSQSTFGVNTKNGKVIDVIGQDAPATGVYRTTIVRIIVRSISLRNLRTLQNSGWR